MLLGILLISTFCIPLLLLLWWMEIKTFWKNRNIVFIAPIPIIGNLNFMLKQNTSTWLCEIYNKYKVPYIGIWLFWKPTLIINCPKLARRILVNDFDIFRNRFMSGGKMDILSSTNLVMVKDPLWSILRKHLAPVFSSIKLKKFQGVINSKSNELAQRLNLEVKENKFIELRRLFSDFSTDVVSLVLFGIPSNGTLKGKSILRDITREFNEFDKHRALSWNFIILFPSLARDLGMTFFPKSSLNYLRKTLNAVIAQRKKSYSAETFDDLLGALSKINDDVGDLEVDATEELLVAQAVVFLEAGFESISLTLTHTIYELSFVPHVQEKIYEEILAVNNSDENSLIPPNLVYINCVIKETLRKCPPLGWLDRVASKDYQLDDHLVIPAGTPVYINMAGIQSDPNFYPDPEKFDPDRFIHDNKNGKNSFSFLAFRDGPRNCIGQKFANLVVYYALASVIKNFKIRPLSDVLTPVQRNFEKRSLILSPHPNYSVQFVPRKPNTS